MTHGENPQANICGCLTGKSAGQYMRMTHGKTRRSIYEDKTSKDYIANSY